jgi:hypothetical protein
LSRSFSSAVGSDLSKSMPECAAGKMCRAPTESQLANSSRHCGVVTRRFILHSNVDHLFLT